METQTLASKYSNMNVESSSKHLMKYEDLIFYFIWAYYYIILCFIAFPKHETIIC